MTSGVYTEEIQEDQSHTIKGQVSVPLTDNVNFIALANYTMADSNQDFETFYRYTYDAFYAAAGFRFRY